MIKIPTFAFAIILMLTSQAQNTNDTTKTIVLSDALISDFSPPQYSNSNATINSINSEQAILTRPERMTDALVFLPGISSVPDGIGGKTLNLRGFEQNRINIYFNGIPIRSNTENNIVTEGFFFSNSDLSIEKGTASLIYGANSSGNVVKAESKLFTPAKLTINTNSFWGNNGKQGHNVFIGVNIKNKWFIQTGVNYLMRNSFPLSNQFDTIPNQPTKKERINTDQKSLEVLNVITYIPHKDHRLTLTCIYDRSKFGYPPSIVNPRYRRMDYWNNTIIGLRQTSTFKSKIIVDNNIYFTYLEDSLNQYVDKTFRTIRSVSYWNDKTLGLRSVITAKVDDNHKFLASFDYKYDIHKQVWFTTATTKANTILTGLEYQGKVLSRIYISSGVSYNFTNPYQSSRNESLERKDLSAVNFQTSVAYSPLNSKFRIHVGYSRTSIFPRMRDLFGDALLPYIPNPNLKTEVASNFDFGTEINFGNKNLTVQFSGYYSNIQNLLTQIKITDTTSQVINLQSARYAGAEALLKYAPSEKLFILCSYSFLDARNTSKVRTSDFIAYRPQHQLKTFVSYMFIKYLGFDVTLSYTSKRYYDNQNVWKQLPGYSLVDVGLTARPIKYISIWVKFNNLFDTNYLNPFDQPQPGREYRIGFTFDYQLLTK